MRVEEMMNMQRVAISSLLLALVGCSGLDQVKPIADLVPCEGTVTFDGQPLSHGTIAFDPVDVKAGQPATGVIENGHFKMATTVAAPGVVAGKYKVQVASTTKNPEPPEPGEMPKPPASLIPTKYNSVSTSGLEVEVKKGMGPVEFTLEKEKE